MSKKKYPNLENESSQASPAQYTLDELKAHLATSLEDIQAGRVYNHDDIPNLRPWWNLISEEERQHINKGLEDIEAGRTISHTEMRKSYEQWL